ncbi:MAG TPA: Ig-like domain-containing protein [Gemmatimonadaceae bacterium]|nr:Ig-like domain-containing protein [Gemmatimonadaceae bacterium]
MRKSPPSFRTILSPVLIGLQALVIASCEPARLAGPAADDASANGMLNQYHRAESVTIAVTDSSLASGQQVKATAEVRDQDGLVVPWAPVTWSASSEPIVTVSSEGLITAGTGTGTATISATSDGITAQVEITVGDGAANSDSVRTSPPSAPVHMVSISANATTLTVGEQTQVSGVVRDINGTPIPNVPITWTTSPVNVATVSSTSETAGLITAKGAGTVTLFAKADTAVRSITLTVTGSASATDSAATADGAPSAPVPPGASGASYGSAAPAELPRATVNTAYPSPARQIRVPAGADLQAAINAAQPGDELLLAPGASYIGNFWLPNKGGSSSWITIRTDVSDAAIGAPGTRMTPSRAASANLAKIQSPNIYSTITTDLTAHHYRFTGVEIGATSSANDINAIVRFGDNTTAQNSAATTANNLILDRTYIHGLPNLSTRRCVMLNSASTAVVDSWISECHSNDGDSQAIVGWNGPGPFLIQNDYLEGGHEVILFGGGGMTTPNASPSDITIRGSHITRPSSWKGVWEAKNLIETKHVRRLLIEGNVIENVWLDGQVGFAFVMKSENQNYDTPWSQSTDVTIRYNRIRNAGGGFNILANPSGAPAVPAARFVITDNVLENIGNAPYTGDGRAFQLLGGLTDIVVMHNTVVKVGGANSAAFSFAQLPSIQRLVVHSNVLHHGAYGVKGGSVGEGTATLNAYTSGALFTNNAIAEGGTPTDYPVSNYFPATLGALGFVDLSGGNYRLGGGSSYLGKGYDNRDIGADISQVDAQTRNAVVDR